MCYEIHSFNSLKVRLKEALNAETINNFSQFQFLKGAIKSKHSVILSLLYAWFQFLKGAIKRAGAESVGDHLLRFNSLMVRLKVDKLCNVMPIEVFVSIP